MTETFTLSPPGRSPLPGLARGAAVTSVGVGLPETRVANAQVAARLKIDEQWIVERTGILERRFAAPEESVADLATIAAESALAAAGVEAPTIDLVVLATISHERLMPIGAALVAARIGATEAGAVDVNAACSGFVTALALAAGQIETGRARTALVIGADVLSPLTDHDDRSTAALFGDGAGAVVVGATAGTSRIGPVVLGSDGARSELITAERDEALIRMNGHDTFRQAVDRLCESTLLVCRRAGIGLEEIDLFAYHQANSRILAAVGDRLELDPARVLKSIGRYGNTSAATIPLTLADAVEGGLLHHGSRVLLSAFGAGLTWAATVIDWGAAGDAG